MTEHPPASMRERRELRRPLDPAQLVFHAPNISPGEDWKHRSLRSWLILAEHEGYDVEATEDGGPPRAVNERSTWCGNVRVVNPEIRWQQDGQEVTDPGMVYRVHRLPAMRTPGVEDGGMTWIVSTCTLVRPIVEDGNPFAMEVSDPRG